MALVLNFSGLKNFVQKTKTIVQKIQQTKQLQTL